MMVTNSVALTAAAHDAAVAQLHRADGQEDICFALWSPSTGTQRRSALIHSLILPGDGDRILHGNVSFTPQFFERAMSDAACRGLGLAMMHSHPQGQGWQSMSLPDVIAEQTNAGAVLGATNHPFLGMTLAGRDHAWSARFWDRTAPRTYAATWCNSVRVQGDQLKVTFHPALMPVPVVTKSQTRTVSAWGEKYQADFARLKVGVIGSGSTGGFIADGLARTGARRLLIMDFDCIEEHNLDRLCYATKDDVGRLKVDVLATHLRRIATATDFSVQTVSAGVYEPEAYRAALDCDVLFSCVDRPWGRHVLNHIAYEHLIPVIDGGILVRTNRSKMLVSADWTAQTVGPGHACLQCLGQYDVALVQAEREGLLDDPKYIEGLADDHPLRARQNVFGFSMACAGLQLLQMLNLVVAPLGIGYSGAQRYHFVDATMEPNRQVCCHARCSLAELVALGDNAPYPTIRQVAG